MLLALKTPQPFTRTGFSEKAEISVNFPTSHVNFPIFSSMVLLTCFTYVFSMILENKKIQAGKTPRLGDASLALLIMKFAYKNLMNSHSPEGETPATSKLVRHHAEDVATLHSRLAGSNEASLWELLKLPPPAFGSNIQF